MVPYVPRRLALAIGPRAIDGGVSEEDGVGGRVVVGHDRLVLRLVTRGPAPLVKGIGLGLLGVLLFCLSAPAPTSTRGGSQSIRAAVTRAVRARSGQYGAGTPRGHLFLARSRRRMFLWQRTWRSRVAVLMLLRLTEKMLPCVLRLRSQPPAECMRLSTCVRVRRW